MAEQEQGLTVTLSRSTWKRVLELLTEDTIRSGIDRQSRFADRRAASEEAYAAAERRESEAYDAVANVLNVH